VAVDEVGKKLAEKAVPATSSGHHQALRWARERFGVEVVWAIEDFDICRLG
jgi:transposase